MGAATSKPASERAACFPDRAAESEERCVVVAARRPHSAETHGCWCATLEAGTTRHCEDSIEEAPGLSLLAQCHQALLLTVAELAVGSSYELVHFCEQSTTFIRAETRLIVDSLWQGLYAQKWPAFHDYMLHQAAKDWRTMYREATAGRSELLLEVFHREKKRGFVMSAMPAFVRYEAMLGGYIAKYISASSVRPELIPHREGYRLRFCPTSARERLRPCSPPAERAVPPYPFRVLEGVDGLKPGQGVELQWKMQGGSPFGWWYAHLEALHHEQGEDIATATITFPHFAPNSQWYRLDVRFGSSQMRPCAFGGFTGGIRPASTSDRKRWALFLPRKHMGP